MELEERLMNTFKVCQNIDFDKYIFSSILQIDYSFSFEKSIKEINSIIGQQQLNVINNTLIIIKKNNISNTKIESDKKKHINMCINWCKENNIPYNDYKKNNIFTN